MATRLEVLSEEIRPTGAEEICAGAALHGKIIAVFDHELVVASNHPEE